MSSSESDGPPKRSRKSVNKVKVLLEASELSPEIKNGTTQLITDLDQRLGHVEEKVKKLKKLEKLEKELAVGQVRNPSVSLFIRKFTFHSNSNSNSNSKCPCQVPFALREKIIRYVSGDAINAVFNEGRISNLRQLNNFLLNESNGRKMSFTRHWKGMKERWTNVFQMIQDVKTYEQYASSEVISSIDWNAEGLDYWIKQVKKNRDVAAHDVNLDPSTLEKCVGEFAPQFRFLLELNYKLTEWRGDRDIYTY